MLISSFSLQGTEIPQKKQRAHRSLCTAPSSKNYAHQAARFFGDIVVDAFVLNKNLFSITSAKILTGFTPLYLITRMTDERIQCNFHDHVCHKNVNQLPKACHAIGRYAIGIPMVGLASLAIFAHDEDLRMTGRIFAIGLPFVHWGKEIIKKLEFNACLRPWHEDFSHKKRSAGGFPSGHMANVTFMATLFGMRFGPKWGVPLGFLASFIFVDFVNCNRHYVSQLVAGAGLGVLFACAADTLIDKKLSDRYELTVGADSSGAPTVTCSYRF